MIRDMSLITFNEKDRITYVLENKKAVVIYRELLGEYIAIDKETRGNEYGYGNYHRSTSGSFARCKKAFEKYSNIK